MSNHSSKITSRTDEYEEGEAKQLEGRKQDHIDICFSEAEKIEMSVTTGFEDILFVHRAAPEVDFEEIALASGFLGFKFSYPIFISSITGGTERAKKINQKIAKVVEQLQIGLGVGSQRSAIIDPSLEDTFSVVRKEAPHSFIAANLGAVQFNNDFTIKHARQAIEMISANALILHFNPLQEVVQPEGDRNFRGVLSKIKEINDKLVTPLIAKEVGSGISLEDANLFAEAGIKAIEVAGAGGTSWAKVEAIRARRKGRRVKEAIGELFADWGIPTVASTIEVSSAKKRLEIIASGGIRDGLQAAKALALGANLVGIALPILRVVQAGGEEQLVHWLKQFILELKTAMFLVGAKNLDELRNVPLVVVGKTAQWLSARGIKFPPKQ